MFEYDNGVLVCTEHRTPAQKNENGFWCRKCADEEAEQTIITGMELQGQ